MRSCFLSDWHALSACRISREVSCHGPRRGFWSAPSGWRSDARSQADQCANFRWGKLPHMGGKSLHSSLLLVSKRGRSAEMTTLSGLSRTPTRDRSQAQPGGLAFAPPPFILPNDTRDNTISNPASPNIRSNRSNDSSLNGRCLASAPQSAALAAPCDLKYLRVRDRIVPSYSSATTRAVGSRPTSPTVAHPRPVAISNTSRRAERRTPRRGSAFPVSPRARREADCRRAAARSQASERLDVLHAP
jgi:hypothetical protein